MTYVRMWDPKRPRESMEDTPINRASLEWRDGSYELQERVTDEDLYRIRDAILEEIRSGKSQGTLPGDSLQWRVVKFQAPERPVCRRIFDCSTAHITARDGTMIRSGMIGGAPEGVWHTILSYGEGAFVYCGCDEMNEWLDHLQDLHEKVGFSQEFCNILEAGRAADCAYVQFDADGTTYPGLTRFSW